LNRICIQRGKQFTPLKQIKGFIGQAGQAQRLRKRVISGWKFGSVHPEMVDFGFRQGPSEFSTAGIARYVED
jgi:hypothetical protein